MTNGPNNQRTTPQHLGYGWYVVGVRANESLALESGHAIIGFNDIPDLTGTGDRVDVSRLVEQADPGSRRISNRTSQLIAVWGMSARDIVAMPLKTRPWSNSPRTSRRTIPLPRN